MGKDFIKFMVLVIVIYLGFLTTFSLVGREVYPLKEMTWFLTKIFYGSSYVGFDIMHNIDPIFGPPLMIIFITLSSILLTGSLTGMLSNSFSRVITHAREEYLYVYSVYVLEASTSNRLTHFYPPFNLLALVIFRPLRLFLPSDNKFRRARILLLKATHLPIVAAIGLYEWLLGKSNKGTQYNGFRGPRHSSIATRHASKRLSHPPQGTAAQSSTSGTIQPLGPPSADRETVPVDDASKVLSAHQQRAAAEAEEGQAFGAPASHVDLRIAELTEKIDRLTELVLALQAQQQAQLQARETESSA